MKELNAFRQFLNENREEFGQESIDKLRDTIEAMGNSEAHQKALDMVDDGIFFAEEPSPPNNVTLGYVEDLNYVKNNTDKFDEEEVEEGQLFLDAAIIIKNAVKKTGPISYGEMGYSFNYYVKGEDLFAQTRETFEVPTNEARYGFFDNEEGNTGSSIVMEALNEYESVVERAFQNLINKTNTAINIGGSGGMDTEVRENLTYQFDKIQEKITTTDYINATFRK